MADRKLVALAALTVALAVPATATAGDRDSALELLANRAADRMAAKCTVAVCMDANEFSTGACQPTRRGPVRCSYTVFGWTYRHQFPVGDFGCTRGAVVGPRRARSIGKTSCADDPGVVQRYPWPTSHCDPFVLPGGAMGVICVDVSAPPPRTLTRPLRRRTTG